MKLKKKELVLSIVLLVAFLALVITTSGVSAADSENTQPMNFYSFSTQNNTTENVENIQIKSTNENQPETINVNTSNNVAANNNNAPEKLANTGLESAPWVVVGICTVSAIFAFKKIKEYKID